MRQSCSLLIVIILVALALAPASAAAKRDKKDEADGTAAADPVAVIAGASAALGGDQGGDAALAALAGYRLTYRMEVHDPLTGLDYVADHVYQRGVDGAIDLEVTLVQGKGVDSIAHAGQDGGWVQVGVERTEFQRDEVLQRVDDFAAESLFQVPLDLATRGIECVPEELRDRLEFGGGATDPPGQNTGQAREQATPLVVRAVDGDGQEQVRMVFDPQTSLLLEASFRSVAGWITYRFGEYREVSDGLWLPTARSYLRNEVLLSALTAVTFEVLTASVLDPQEQPEPDVASEKITP